MSASDEAPYPGDAVERIRFDADTIQARVQELAASISRDYAGKDLVMVSVLRGAIFFMTDLAAHIPLPLSMDFMSISHYAGPSSSGAVRIIKDLEEDITGRHVLMVEDIVDTGLTLNYLLNSLDARRPASLEVCTLLDRSSLRLASFDVKYRGFAVGSEFLVGYGLDYRQHYRNLPYIGVLSEHMLSQEQ